MIIVGLGYKARSGKDLIGDFLSKFHGFRKTAFAENLKTACANIFGLTDAQLNGDKKEVIDEFWKTTPRHILQCVGTECLRRHFDEDIWIKSLEKRILTSPNDSKWIITDMRFLNEVQAVRSWGGRVFRVDRPAELRQQITGNANHPSEIELDGFSDWDGIILNDKTIEDLYEKVYNIIVSKK